jgi:osmotically-inducible protein OsmY
MDSQKQMSQISAGQQQWPANSGLKIQDQHRLRPDYPDQDLQQRIQCFLQTRHFPNFRNLDVKVENGHVRLLGHVGSFYEKQIALSSCQRVAGVLSLSDEVSVDDPDLTTLPTVVDPTMPCLVDFLG